MQILLRLEVVNDRRLMASIKRENFIRLAEARVTRAIDAMRVIGNLSNRSNYDYNEEDVKAIINTLQTELTALKAQFKTKRGMSVQGFRLKK
jgi:hypothetical protein